MFQVRLHGRGGQDVAITAGLLAVAAPDAGRHAQAFPGSGSEPMGAPVMSFCRIDDQPIRTNEPVTEPDARSSRTRGCLTWQTCSLGSAGTVTC